MTTLVIFSGLPGTGKSMLADRLARELKWTLLRIDDVVGYIPENPGVEFWDTCVRSLFAVTEAQLEIGLNVVVESVFMNMDRYHAQTLARKYNFLFRPIYVFTSDEELWKERVTARFNRLKNPAVATWERVQHQRERFRPWQPDTALFVDSVNPIEKNFADVFNFVTDESVALIPLEELPLMPGKYH